MEAFEEEIDWCSRMGGAKDIISASEIGGICLGVFVIGPGMFGEDV